jgi:hypothetical protein
MQVLVNTPQRLHLTFQKEIHSQRFQGVLFLGLALFFGGLTFSDPVHRLTCQPQVDPPVVACEATQLQLLRSPQVTLTVSDVQRAELGRERRQLRSGGVTVYALRLMTTSGQQYTFPGETRSRSEQAQNVLAVNQYLAGPQIRPLVIQVRPSWISQLLLSALLLAIGGLGVFLLSNSFPYSCLLDRRSDQLVVMGKRLQGNQKLVYRLSQIDRVQVSELGYENVNMYISEIILKSGEKIPLLGYSSCADQEQVAQLINRFLKR